MYGRNLLTNPKIQIIPNKEKIINIITKHPGLRFYQIKNQTKIANGTIQHHLIQLINSKTIKVYYIKKIPRYFTSDIEKYNQIILLRVRQNTTSKIINSLLINECQTFSQLVKFSKKSPGTVSVYKNMLLADKIIVGDTNPCKCSGTLNSKIKYRLVDPSRIHLLITEYGKSSLKKSSDNLVDIFLSL